MPSRLGSVAIAGDMVWLTSTGIYSQEHASDLIGLNRATGEQRHRSSFDDNMYGWADVAFGAGKVVFAQGGSFGGSTPRTMRVYGLGGPRPTIADKVIPLGRVGHGLLPPAHRRRCPRTTHLDAGGRGPAERTHALDEPD